MDAVLDAMEPNYAFCFLLSRIDTRMRNLPVLEGAEKRARTHGSGHALRTQHNTAICYQIGSICDKNTTSFSAASNKLIPAICLTRSIR